ncbi:MAG: DUF3883 domain-containing protein [Bacteroidetes bacterium]|nr:DUF3883 domain-containing protein [Bacteroidota bacterium]
MLRINFIEVANLCSLFSYFKKFFFNYNELRSLFLKNRILSIDQSFDEIIKICLKLQILELDKGILTINPCGSKLGYLHKSIKPSIELNVREHFIKGILFNIKLQDYCPASFLNKFQADTIQKTYFYERTVMESYEETNWLINLNAVGLIEVDNSSALLKPEYLEITNILLRKFRFGDNVYDKNDEFRNKIGDYAELKAMEYEMSRLKTNGFEELSSLIKRISLVDNYAGYDILSFVGKGSFPDDNIYIEVKGTTDDKVKFTWTGNEIKKAKMYKNKYHIYCFHNINLSSSVCSGPHIIKNPIKKISEMNFVIEPIRLYVEKK